MINITTMQNIPTILDHLSNVSLINEKNRISEETK